MKASIANVAQTIAQHATMAPRQQGQPQVKNELSPHFERLVGELFRHQLLIEVQAIETGIVAELTELRKLIRPRFFSRFDQTCARLMEKLRSAYKED